VDFLHSTNLFGKDMSNLKTLTASSSREKLRQLEQQDELFAVEKKFRLTERERRQQHALAVSDWVAVTARKEQLLHASDDMIFRRAAEALTRNQCMPGFSGRLRSVPESVVREGSDRSVFRPFSATRGALSSITSVEHAPTTRSSKSAFVGNIESALSDDFSIFTQRREAQRCFVRQMKADLECLESETLNEGAK
jgi:hypothetical protein